MIAMGAIPEWHATRRPDAPAVIHGSNTLTWAELSQSTAKKTRYLKKRGVLLDDRVVMLMPNGNAFVEWAFAIWMAGATPMPMPATLPLIERNRLLELGTPRLIVSPQEANRDISAERWVESGQLSPLIAASWKAMASGGSTGVPKLIVADREAATDPETYELFPWSIHQGRLGRPCGVMLNPGPLFHNGPFVHAFMNLFAGSTLIGMERFDAEEWLRLIERHRVEFSYLVPTMMHRIWSLPEATRASYDISSLRGVVHTAAPCPPWLKQAWIDWLGPDRVWETYGSTEAVAATLIDGHDWLDHRGSVGRFFFGAKGQVLDEAGGLLEPQQVGELWVRPPRDRKPGFTYVGAEPTVCQGWYAFGDFARMDEEGYVYIADRRNDLIIRGGNNVYPAEVEAALEEHPEILSAAVIGLPDPDLGSCVHAIVQVDQNAEPLMDDISAFLKTRLAAYKRPSSIEFVTAPLRNSAGKVRRSQLRDERLSSRQG